MKLHLPTKLRAAVMAAMAFFALAPAATAMDIDPSTAVYDKLLMGASDSVTLPMDLEPSDGYQDHTLRLPTGLEYEDSWSMVIQSSGWTTISDQLIFGWDDSNVMFGAGKQNWLTYANLHHGFALMISSGRLVMMNSSCYTDYNGKIGDYKENGILLSGLGKQKDVSVELTITYDRPTEKLIVQSGTLTYGETVHTIDTHSYEGIKLPDTDPMTYYTTVGGSELNPGAVTTVTTILPGTETAWNLNGVTSLEGLKAGEYNDIVSGDTPTARPLLGTDGIYFVGGAGVLYTESNQTIANTLGTALIAASPTTPSSIGLGAAAGAKLTVTQGATALGQGDGLRIIGNGEVELQTGAIDPTTTKLSLADGATLTVTGDNMQNFEVSGSRISAASSLSSQSGLNLNITDGSDVMMKNLTVGGGATNIYGKGTYTVNGLDIAGGTANIGYISGKDAVAVSAGDVKVSADYFNILDGNSLQAASATFTGSNVSVMGKMDIASVTSDAVVAAMNAVTWATPVSIDKLTADAFTATKLVMDAETGKASATSLNKALATISAGGELSIVSATDSTIKSKNSTLDATSVTGGLKIAADSSNKATIVADDVKLNSSTLKGQDEATIKALTINGASTLTVKGEAVLTTKSLTGNAMEVQGSAGVVSDTMQLDTLTLSGSSETVATQLLKVDDLTMSEDALLSAARLEVTSATINIPTSTFVLTPSSTVQMNNVVATDAVLGTTQGVVSGISGGAGSSVSVGTGYNLIGLGDTPAMVDVDTMELADGAALTNIGVTTTTALTATGTQTFDKVTLLGGYNSMHFDSTATPYLTVSSALPNNSTLDSVAISGTATATQLAIDFLEINGENLSFVKDTWRSYELFTADSGVDIVFDTTDTNNRQYNITPYTYADLSVETVSGKEVVVIRGREAKEEISAALRNTENRTAAMDAMSAADAAGINGQLQTVFNSIGDIYHLSEAQRQQILSAASGASLTALSDTQRRGIEDTQKNLRNRIIQMGGQEAGALKSWEEGNIQAWAQADGAYHMLDQDKDNAGYDFSTYGATVGANLDLNRQWTVGGAISASYGNISGKGVDCFDADTQSYYLNLFARYQKGHWTQMGILTVGMDEMDGERRVSGNTAKSDTKGTSFSGYYEVGYLVPLSDTMEHILQPVVNVSISSAKVDGFTETGSIGNAGLKYGSNDLVYGNVGAGVRYQGVLAHSVYERNTMLEVRAQVNQHFGDKSNEADVSYIGGGNTFMVRGSESSDLGVQIGAGVSIPYNIDYTFFADVDAEFRNQQSDVRANIGVRYDF